MTEQVFTFDLVGYMPILPKDNMFTSITGDVVVTKVGVTLKITTVHVVQAENIQGFVNECCEIILKDKLDDGWKNVTVKYVGSRLQEVTGERDNGVP